MQHRKEEKVDGKEKFQEDNCQKSKKVTGPNGTRR